MNLNLVDSPEVWPPAPAAAGTRQILAETGWLVPPAWWSLTPSTSQPHTAPSVRGNMVGQSYLH